MAVKEDGTSQEQAKSFAAKTIDEQSTSMKGSPSIVADVLSKKGLCSVTALNQAMKELSLKTDNLKSQIYGATFKHYTEFYHQFNLGDELNRKLVKLIREINKLGDDIENNTLVTMVTADSELQQLTSDYDKNHEIIKTLKKLLKMHDCIQTCTNGLYSKDYLPASKAAGDMRNHLNDLAPEAMDIKIFKAIVEEYRKKNLSLVSALQTDWTQLVEWSTVTSVSWDGVDGHLKTSLRIQCPDRKTHGVASLISLYEAMEYVDILDARLKTFAKKLLRFLLKPHIKFPSLKPVIEGDKLRIKKEDMTIKAKTTDPATLFRKLMIVMQFIAKSMFPDVPADEKKPNGNVKSKSQDPKKAQFLQKLRSFAWPELSELIIKDCLSPAAPTNNTQLKEYEVIIAATKNFEQELRSLGFLEDTQNELSSYVGNMNIHFTSKKVQDLIVKAHDLMTSEIHNMVKVEEDEDRARLITSVDEKDKQFSKETRLLHSTRFQLYSLARRAITENSSVENNLFRKKYIKLAGLKDFQEGSVGGSLFKFPECRISESTQKLRDLVYNTLIEASMATPEIAVQLFYTARNMLELFCDVVPTYHRESLQLPQLAALHHNNSMYLAHHCITIGHQFKSALPEMLNEGGATFIDLVPVLRKCGESCFLENLKKQKLQLLEIIAECDGFNSLHIEDDAYTTKKAFEQIISQLVRLSRVWKDVLPKHFYEKILALLFNSVLDNIISQILQLEDISTEQAVQFNTLLKILVDRAGEIFNLSSKDDNSPTDMGFIVKIPSWQKFNELIQMMDSSLQGIVDRWADEKGPLSQCFEAADVRSLIKALFQNTNIRAQALSKIKQA